MKTPTLGATGAKLAYGPVYRLDGRSRIGQVGMGSEVDMVRIGTAKRGQCVVADAGVLVPELPAHYINAWDGTETTNLSTPRAAISWRRAAWVMRASRLASAS